MSLDASVQIHETAVVENGATLKEGVRIWHFVHVREGAVLHGNVSVGKGSYIDKGVEIGRGSRIQNDVNIYTGVKVGQFCFVGPAVVFTNDLLPRVGNKSWDIVETKIADGASIGAGAVIRCGVSIGEFAMIGAGALVTKSVPPFTLALGHPAEGYRRVCGCGQTVKEFSDPQFSPISSCCEINMSQETLKLARQYAASENLNKTPSSHRADS